MSANDWTLLSAEGDTQKWIRHNLETGKDEIFSTTDVEPLLDLNKEALARETGNFKGDMHHMARIPNEIWMQWWTELGDNPGAARNREFLKKKLNDPDNKYFRVKSGRI